MTVRIYLTGQNNFGNRGCEALVRSTVQVVRQQLGPTTFLVPSFDADQDRRQWPDAEDHGVRFVTSPTVPGTYIQWSRVCSRLPFLTRIRWPRYQPDATLLHDLEGCDAVLALGGDSYSLDYDLASLYFYAGIAELGLRLGKPVVLWGASVGPFSAQPGVEKQMIDLLRRFSILTVRESHSIRYLESFGLSGNVIPVVDSAFAMAPQAVDVASFWPRHDDKGVLGLNLSPVIEQLRGRTDQGPQIITEVARFIRHAVLERGLSVLLIPHVDPLDGNAHNSDTTTMKRILAEVGDLDDRVRLVPPGMNAPQLKSIIARCRFFIGARTHATIAAFSTGVPTISIAYSVKARGINRDLFGHERYVLDTPSVSTSTLTSGLSTLEQDEVAVRSLLGERIPEWKERATASAVALRRMLNPQAGQGALGESL